MLTNTNCGPNRVNPKDVNRAVYSVYCLYLYIWQNKQTISALEQQQYIPDIPFYAAITRVIRQKNIYHKLERIFKLFAIEYLQYKVILTNMR